MASQPEIAKNLFASTTTLVDYPAKEEKNHMRTMSTHIWNNFSIS